MSPIDSHLLTEDLLAYWLSETSPASSDEMEEHLMACEACGEQLDGLIALAQGVRSAFHAGEIGAMTSSAFVRQVREHGLRVREYRLEPDGSVPCTVSPDDDVLVSRLAAPLAGVRRLDAIAESSLQPGVRHRMEDIPFDAEAGEVVYLSRLSQVRGLPAQTLRFVLLSVEADGTRELGTYTFRHRPWET